MTLPDHIHSIPGGRLYLGETGHPPLSQGGEIREAKRKVHRGRKLESGHCGQGRGVKSSPGGGTETPMKATPPAHTCQRAEASQKVAHQAPQHRARGSVPEDRPCGAEQRGPRAGGSRTEPSSSIHSTETLLVRANPPARSPCTRPPEPGSPWLTAACMRQVDGRRSRAHEGHSQRRPCWSCPCGTQCSCDKYVRVSDGKKWTKCTNKGVVIGRQAGTVYIRRKKEVPGRKTCNMTEEKCLPGLRS